jgi:hypothetical protein
LVVIETIKRIRAALGFDEVCVPRLLSMKQQGVVSAAAGENEPTGVVAGRDARKAPAKILSSFLENPMDRGKPRCPDNAAGDDHSACTHLHERDE